MRHAEDSSGTGEKRPFYAEVLASAHQGEYREVDAKSRIEEVIAVQQAHTGNVLRALCCLMSNEGELADHNVFREKSVEEKLQFLESINAMPEGKSKLVIAQHKQLVGIKEALESGSRSLTMG